ncbi:glycosyltransferase family 9 protein [Pseudodesulfovibrio piezophilus]|uniref:Glycosyl transferase family 9 n=1 Tax=Pseudodesulfovibrio piezophilus (strain DSM 21447 / JCM 15486 / C1TLV30) TaxID=1322246 RepID=M1WJI4_PSEP2|nr:glycosyltransferase family 9 protein [Pseudodesulfovibrio piezophilus]CCH47951.1 Glycosyl transferase family 9 [Pseudodesulfovibrio piezophilus C1TLV30]
MEQILIIQLARFGDLLQTKRLIVSLCAQKKQVHLCLDSSLEALARLIYPNVILHPVAAHGTGHKDQSRFHSVFLTNRRAFEKLKSIPFEAVFNLNFSGLNFRLAALFDPDIVHGYSWKNGQEIIGVWPSMGMRWSETRRLGLNLVDFWAGYLRHKVAPEDVNPTAEPRGGGLGVVLAGRESRRSLPVPVLAAIIQTLVVSSSYDSIQLLGGSQEYGAAKQLLKLLPRDLQQKSFNLAGKTSYSDLVERVAGLDCLVTPDTGTMHLAAHLGTPVKAFFLSSAWCFETGPYGKGHIVYQATTNCLPCLESQPCPYETRCLECFFSSEFKRFMVTEKEAHAPENMIAFRSDFDELGQIYVPFAGQDKESEKRTQFRHFLQQYLTGEGEGASDTDTTLALRLYSEKDWMMSEGPKKLFGI